MNRLTVTNKLLLFLVCAYTVWNFIIAYSYTIHDGKLYRYMLIAEDILLFVISVCRMKF